MPQKEHKIDIIFEDFPDNTVFNGNITWEQLRSKLAERILSWTPWLVEQGIRKVEVGSIGWFYMRKRTRGRFVNLNTMFFARLLKR